MTNLMYRPTSHEVGDLIDLIDLATDLIDVVTDLIECATDLIECATDLSK